jgi:hypothetical protein
VEGGRGSDRGWHLRAGPRGLPDLLRSGCVVCVRGGKIGKEGGEEKGGGREWGEEKGRDFITTQVMVYRRKWADAALEDQIYHRFAILGEEDVW